MSTQIKQPFINAEEQILNALKERIGELTVVDHIEEQLTQSEAAVTSTIFSNLKASFTNNSYCSLAGKVMNEIGSATEISQTKYDNDLLLFKIKHQLGAFRTKTTYFLGKDLDNETYIEITLEENLYTSKCNNTKFNLQSLPHTFRQSLLDRKKKSIQVAWSDSNHLGGVISIFAQEIDLTKETLLKETIKLLVPQATTLPEFDKDLIGLFLKNMMFSNQYESISTFEMFYDNEKPFYAEFDNSTETVSSVGLNPYSPESLYTITGRINDEVDAEIEKIYEILNKMLGENISHKQISNYKKTLEADQF